MTIRHLTTTACVAVIASGALLAGITPALAVDAGPSPAARAASVVERATGTSDITGSVALAGGSEQAVTAGAAGQSTVTIPATANGTVKAVGDGTSVGIALVGASGAKGVRTEHGTVVYPGAVQNADLAVQPTDGGGVRSLVTVRNADAAREYRFDLGLPAGAALSQQPDGSVVVLQGGRPLGTFAAPWAKDANGRSVPTSYRIDGGALVQTVGFDRNTAFPVVADPWWNPKSWNKDCLAAGLGTIGGGLGAIGTVVAAPETGGASLAATGALLGGAGSAVAGLKACK